MPGLCAGAWCLVLCLCACAGCWCCVGLAAGAVSGCWGRGRGRESVSELKYRDEEILLQTFIIIPIYLFGLLFEWY